MSWVSKDLAPAESTSWPVKVRGYPQAYDHLWITPGFCEINHTDQFGHIVTIY